MPSSTILLCRGVPLDPSYEHTIYFTSASEQYSTLSSYAHVTCTNYSFQRNKRNYVKVNGNVGTAYACNYLIYTNPTASSKHFYAFIDEVEYMSDTCYYVYFTIDVMQTWHFNYSLGENYVLREHSYFDTIYTNYEPEPIDPGEYVYNNHSTYARNQTGLPLAVVFLVTDLEQASGGINIDGIYSGCAMYAYNVNDLGGIEGLISQYSTKPESIVMGYTCPSGILPNVGGTVSSGGFVSTYSTKISAPSKSSTIDGYRPKNMKMYTYPYNFFNLSNGTDSAVYRYELSDNSDHSIDIGIQSTCVYPVSHFSFAKNYKGCGNTDQNAFFENSLEVSGYPQVSWTSDAFKQWSANSGLLGGMVALGTSLASMASVAGVGATTASTAGAAALGSVAAPAIGVGAVVGIGTFLAQTYISSRKADVQRGSLISSNPLLMINGMGFSGGRMSVTERKARIIDEFFTKYGYATNRLKVPNRNARPHWNYVQLSDTNITGSVPTNDAVKICNIYNKGITFWRNASEVGDYSLDNSPS